MQSDHIYKKNYVCLNIYNPFLVYCRELAPGTVSLTGGRAQGDDSKHESHYRVFTVRTFHLLLNINY